MAETTKTQLQVNFSDMLNDKLLALEDALPKEFNKQRFITNTLAVLNDKPELKDVNKQQLLTGLVKGAMLNLDYSNREFYLLPYGNTVQFQFDYRGLQKVAKQYSINPIREIRSELVREGDEFKVEIVDNNYVINFSPLPFNDGDIVGVFCYIKYEDETVVCERMSVKEVNDVRNTYSKAKDSKAWKNSWGEMARKSCIRRALKTVELSFENAEARKIYEDESDSDFTIKKQPTGDIVSDPFAKNEEEAIDVEATVIDSLEDDLPDFMKG